ncbi:hypothetical protein GCM10015535_68760 [Streptomyces gelaticus]|uniref:Uncharacterized protein n=1 Tax=Streptomyces gelaticus TaxID=285446 RepID=A0ABQ2WA18_9ACTN|nr:hypothetical protein [Streptomyces gelaticus]GGV97421.1 hypothetical protein GCM10015535_68760 [Streptomyces gelaticus]
MNPAEPDRGRLGPEFVDGLGETLRVQPGRFPVGPGLVDALPTVGDDQGDECAGSGDHPEGEFHQVEERLGVELGGGVDLLEVEQHHQPVEDAARGQDRGGEGEGQRPAGLPQPKLSFIRRAWPLTGCHDGEDKTLRRRLQLAR